MRPRINRIVARPPNRLFTRIAYHRSRPQPPLLRQVVRFLTTDRRPQLPFLAQRNGSRQIRFLTTERKQWIKGEVIKAGKWTAALWAIAGLGTLALFGIQTEIAEVRYPTPHQWTWVSRQTYRFNRFNEARMDMTDEQANYAAIGQIYQALLRRLENPEIDGEGLVEQTDGGNLAEGIGKIGYDITAKPEEWQRGYWDTLMQTARCAERMDGWVEDTTRNLCFPKHFMIGPSNPKPRPIPPGVQSAPLEENCVPAFEPPEQYYVQILTTKGFTERQKLEAGLAYAGWLDYKGTPDAALDMYKWCVDIATASFPDVVDKNGVIKSSKPVSSNVLLATTCLATHHAQTSNLSTALPIFVSILRARRSLPEPKTPFLSIPPDATETGIIANLRWFVEFLFIPPKYPPPPDPGMYPPTRDAKEKCEEAGVMAYIGEILYASHKDTKGREEGLAWTREAVDMSEEELRGLQTEIADKDARETCRDCLETGMENWAKMVGRLVREEKKRKEEGKGQNKGWFGLGGKEESAVGRWDSEAALVRERRRRAEGLLKKEEPQKSLLAKVGI